MKVRSWVTLGVGAALIVIGVGTWVATGSPGGAIPAAFGAALAWLGFRGGRVALLIFGHTCIVVGFVLITWGIYLLPYSRPDVVHILGRPLFWGMVAVGGGVCANYHGFCKCIRGPKGSTS